MAGTAPKNDPDLWERVKAEVTAGDKGGQPGQWSARKAQLATAEYKKAGGTYGGPKQADNHLSQWTREDWGTGSGKPSGETHERYLPSRARQSLSKDEYDRSTAAKRRDSAAGKQFSRQPTDVAAKAAKARRAAGDARQPPAKGTRRRSMDDGNSDAWTEFLNLVNMPPDVLREWLDTEDSQRVGWTHEGETEAVGHQSGRRILELLERGEAPTDGDDQAFLNKVISYVRRHSAQRPDGDVSDTRWRHSLMNWGNDPLRDSPGKPKRRTAAPRGKGGAARTAKAREVAPGRRGTATTGGQAATKRASAGATGKRASAGATTRSTRATKVRGTGTAAKRTNGAAGTPKTGTARIGTAKAGTTTKSAPPRRTTGVAAKRSAATTAKRPGAKRVTAAPTKRATTGTTKRTTSATAKRTASRTQQRTEAKPPAKRQAVTATKRGAVVASKRAPTTGTAKRGTRSGTARGAAGRTATAPKGGRGRPPSTHRT